MNNTGNGNCNGNRYCNMRRAISVGLKSEKLRSAVLWELGEKYGFTQNEIEVLIFLHNNPELNTSKDIVKYRWTSKSLVCKSVRSLLDREFLDPAADYDDGRVMRLMMTDKTKEIAKTLAEAEQKFYSEIFSALNDSEMEVIGQLSDKVDMCLDELCKKSKKKNCG